MNSREVKADIVKDTKASGPACHRQMSAISCVEVEVLRQKKGSDAEKNKSVQLDFKPKEKLNTEDLSRILGSQTYDNPNGYNTFSDNFFIRKVSSLRSMYYLVILKKPELEQDNYLKNLSLESVSLTFDENGKIKTVSAEKNDSAKSDVMHISIAGKNLDENEKIRFSLNAEAVQANIDPTKIIDPLIDLINGKISEIIKVNPNINNLLVIEGYKRQKEIAKVEGFITEDFNQSKRNLASYLERICLDDSTKKGEIKNNLFSKRFDLDLEYNKKKFGILLEYPVTADGKIDSTPSKTVFEVKDTDSKSYPNLSATFIYKDGNWFINNSAISAEKQSKMESLDDLAKIKDRLMSLAPYVIK